ncbi:MAG: response regulator [Candidatus Omnitrophica bacterium]|nr:response regulator [Candidatus Omnitrophota bacterium]MBD3268582.1 response regulator [Candidatus Omnitrophota bacterium]
MENNKKSILLVDDDAEFCEELKDLLEEEGYEIDTASDGREGLKTALTKSYDLIFLDIKLPGMNGLDILEKLKSESVESPVIIISASPSVAKYTSSEVKNDNFGEDAALKLADGAMGKPFDIEKTLKTVEELTGR